MNKDGSNLDDLIAKALEQADKGVQVTSALPPIDDKPVLDPSEWFAFDFEASETTPPPAGQAAGIAGQGVWATLEYSTVGHPLAAKPNFKYLAKGKNPLPTQPWKFAKKIAVGPHVAMKPSGIQATTISHVGTPNEQTMFTNDALQVVNTLSDLQVQHSLQWMLDMFMLSDQNDFAEFVMVEVGGGGYTPVSLYMHSVDYAPQDGPEATVCCGAMLLTFKVKRLNILKQDWIAAGAAINKQAVSSLAKAYSTYLLGVDEPQIIKLSISPEDLGIDFAKMEKMLLAGITAKKKQQPKPKPNPMTPIEHGLASKKTFIAQNEKAKFKKSKLK